VKTDYTCLDVNRDKLPSVVTPGLPRDLKQEKMVPARSVAPLVSNKDAMKLKVYTSAILRKARLEKHQKKKGQWMAVAKRNDEGEKESVFSRASSFFRSGSTGDLLTARRKSLSKSQDIPMTFEQKR